MPKHKVIKVIALGGSIVNPGRPDVFFLEKFREIIIDLIEKRNYKFLIVVGGGKLCRIFQASLKELSPNITNEALDWLGIKTTYLNAYFTAKVFGDYADSKILTSFKQKILLNKNIVFGAGVKPGWSTDYDAFYWANKLMVKEVILPTNVRYIYDQDPNKFASAKPLKHITWEKYIRLISDKWSPGLNVPIDQKAADFAKRHKMIAYVFDGKNLNNFKKALFGKSFTGTIVKP